MSKQQIKSERVESEEMRDSKPVIRAVSIQFADDLPLHFPVIIQSQDPMNNPSISSEKPLIPALFQIAAHADEAESMSALRRALSSSPTPVAEMMLDPGKLEAVLREIARKKKGAPRRVSEKRFSINNGEPA